LERLKLVEARVAELENGQRNLQQAYGSSRLRLRRFSARRRCDPQQHLPRPIFCPAGSAPALPADAPSIAIVTPSYNQGRFLRATVDSVLGQNYPKLSYHVQDGGSTDDPPSSILWRQPELAKPARQGTG
jgi:hypothetical protein